ncbi:FYVE and coiled-coil domain-containing protein 1-like isoform X2 [Saccostrea echinata]|uniref:FYVE and coiled-coil domain-containing protein 1-like isoform X2 n=1 Tax=Saccostrea echinata TaxID=191078 RepID=UPI002A8274FE|nr:FYVE and coiled-coil domain-containing protein 1-like isoform X2 [Saccostrea echinata]
MSVPIVPFTGSRQQVSPSPGPQMSSSPTLVSYPQNDKIIHDISECIADMKSDFEDNHQPITDDSQQLQRFCAKLEYLLRADMKDKYSMLGKKKDYWDYICDCLGSTKGINDGIKYVKTLGDYKTSVGKGRAFLRFCLMHNRMADSIQACIMNGKVTSDYFHPKSIWLNHDKSSSLISNLYDLSELQFDLAPRGYDLDNAWPSFAKKTQQGNHHWNPPSRADSMSSLISIPIQDRRGESFSESYDVENSLRQEYDDQIEALEQQKKSLQQSVVHSKTDLEVLQGQYSEMKAQHEALTAENKELQRSYDRMCIEVESKETEITMKEEVHQREIKSVEEDLKKKEEVELLLQEKISKLEKSHQDSLESHNSKIKELKKNNGDLQMQVRTLMSDLSTSIESETKKSELISSQDNKIKTLETKNQELLQKVENMITTKDSEASAKMDSVNQMQELVGNLKEVEAEKLRLEVQCEELKKESDSRKLWIEKTEKEKAESEEKWQNNVNDLQRQVKELKESASLERENNEQRVKELGDKLSDFVTKFDGAVEKLKILEYEKAGLDSELIKKNSSLEEKEKQVSELNNQAEQMKNEHDSKIANLSEKIKIQTDIVKEKDEQLDENCSKISGLESSLQDKSDICLKLNEKVSQLSHEKDDFEQVCANLRTELKHANDKNELVSNSKEENQRLVEEKLQVIEEKDKMIESMLHSVKWVISEDGENQLGKAPSVDGNPEFSSVIGTLCEQINSVKCQLSEVLSEKSTVQNKLTESNQTLKIHNAQISKLQEEKLSLQGVIETSKSQQDDLQQKILEKDRTLSEMENRIRDLQQRLGESETTLQKTITKCDEYNAQNIKLQEEIVLKSSDITALKEQSSKTEAELQQSCKTNVDNIESKKALEEKIQQQEKVVSSQSEKIRELQSSKAALEECVKRHENEARQWKEKYDVTSTEHGQQSKKMEKLLERNKELQRGTEELQKEKSQLEEKKKAVQTKLFDLEREFSLVQDEKKKQNKEHKTVLDQMESERTDLNVKLEEALSELHTFKEQLNDTSSELETVYSEKEKTETEKLELEQQLDKLREEFGQSEIQREGAEHDLRNIQEESRKLMEEKEKLLEDMEKLQLENSELAQKMEKLSESEELQQSKNCDLHKKLSELEEELKRNNSEWEGEKQEVENKIQALGKTVSEMEVERNSLQDKVKDLESELSDTSQRIEQLEHSLEEAMLENQTMKQCKEEDTEAQTKLNSEIETMKQEITALNFQLSSDQIEHEKSLQSNAAKEADLKSFEEKLQEKDVKVQALEKELMTLKRDRETESESSRKQLDDLKSKLITMEKEKEALAEELAEKRKDLETKEKTCVQLRKKEEEKNDKLKSIEESKDKEISQLKSDMKQLKKKIVQLTKEKDTLWQQTDRLTYEQKMQSSAKWMDEKTVTKCLGCKQEFTFMVRKHHCRLCGGVFCHNCSNNYVDSTYSSKKSRACNLCYQKYTKSDALSSSMISRLQEDEGLEDSSEEEQTSTKLLSSHQNDAGIPVPNIDSASKNQNETITDAAQPQPVLTNPPQKTSTPIKGSDVQTAASAVPEGDPQDSRRVEPDEVMIPGQVAANISISVVGQNETDEIKRVKKGSVGDGSEGLSKDEIFHLVSDEEVARSQSVSSSEFQYQDPDPNVTTGITIKAEELEKGEVNNSSEFWVKAGKSHAIPVVIDKQNTVLCWEFRSHPKDVIFSVTYVEFDRPDPAITHCLVPACKCDSHKQAVRGELTAKQTGIYTLLFDNTYSRITAKKICYSLWTRHLGD